ncbi:MAG: hypothetical protein JNK26_03590 [Candidatus Doudnabacteria bacterium]|nr:hypothetical protein [Candidatus Doudnabacteria bacterium]
MQKFGNKYLIIALFFTVTILAVAIAVMLIQNSQKSQPEVEPNSTTSSRSVGTVSSEDTEAAPTGIMWSFDGETWKAMGNVPNCPTPLTFKSPVDLSLATNVLYPGQVRGGNYKPHGGFRFDNSPTNKITVRMPIDAILWRGSRYIEAGEVQIILDFVAPCGVMIRFDHLLTLSDEFAAIVDAELPAAQPDDSRTHYFKTQKLYRQGTLVAEEIGHTNPLNVGMDWGVYDLRAHNTQSQNTVWAQQHSTFKETAYYAICWLDYLEKDEKTLVKALPGGGTEGKISDYCN